MLKIGYDKEESTEFEPKYFVYEHVLGCENIIIYKGTYVQCVCIVGANQLDPNMTIQELRSKTNGFI